MGAPGATSGSQVVSVDTHIVMVPSPGGPVPTPLPHPFSGQVNGGVVATVRIGGQPVAVKGSIATNSPAHLPTPPGTSFQRPPANQGTIEMGSPTVKVGGQPAARMGDQVRTCNDPSDLPTGSIVGPATTVFVG
jgi:uncharacterized Zn-binding protein involved in type VI secretion